LNISDVSDSELVGDAFKQSDSNSWRKGQSEFFSLDEYEMIKSILSQTNIDNHFYPKEFSGENYDISLMFDTKNLNINSNIINVHIQKVNNKFCIHLQEYSGEKDYLKYDKTKTFLYELSFNEFQEFLEIVVSKINSFV
jgi:hypothetical protein